MSNSVLFSGCLLLVVCAGSQGQIDPVNDKNLQGVPVYTVDTLDPPQDVTLDCFNTSEGAGDNTYPVGSVPDQWLLPREEDGTIPVMQKSEINGNVEVSSDARFLTVTGVTRANLGTYHCIMIVDDGGTYLVRLGLNTRGPYFINQWEEWYKSDTLKGFFGFFLSLGTISTTIVVYHMYTEKKEEEENENEDIERDLQTLSGSLAEKNGGMENLAYQSTAAVEDVNTML